MKLKSGQVYVGGAGRATEILHTLEPSDPPDVSATLGAWFLQCPGQSPAWQHYHLSVIHLRPILGVKPATINRQGATHEVMLAALDPKYNPLPDDMGTWHWLLPLNFVGQLELPSDENAKTVLDILARAVADGFLWAEPPLSLQREPWESQLRHLEEHAKGKHAH
jgi:hypothetical protein